MYKALTYIVLSNYKFAPGSTFTKKQLKAAGQSDQNIQQLIDDGALSQDPKASLHKDHQPIIIEGKPGTIFVIGNDSGAGNG